MPSHKGQGQKHRPREHRGGIHPYGVWKAFPRKYTVEHRSEDPSSPHLSLYFNDGQGQDFDDDNDFSRDDEHEEFGGKNRYGNKKHGGGGRHGGRGGNKEIPGLSRAAINIKSGAGKESRLVYWVNRNFNEHLMVNNLKDLESGFHSLENEEKSPASMRLDFIRSNLFNVYSGRLLPHDIEGPSNDMIDVLEPEVQKAIREKAQIYLFGEKFNGGGDGIHNCHMNQGNSSKWQRDDGVFQDGGLLINYPSSGQWVGIFLGFASQAAHTDDETGHATTSETWADYLDPKSNRNDLLESSVSIDEASMDTDQPNASRPRNTSVTLSNWTDHKIPMSNWKVKNSAGESHTLPKQAELDVTASRTFDLAGFALSKIGDTLTLLNDQGLKVDGVSYNSYPRGVQGQSVAFVH